MSTVKFTIETEAGDAINAQIKLDEGQKKIQASTVRTTRAMRDQERQARKVYESTRKPLEVYNDKLSQSNRLLKLGKISQETYERSVSKAKEELRKQTGETVRLAEATRKAATQQKKMGDEGKQVYNATRTPLEQHNAKVRRLGQLLRANTISQDTYTRAVARSKVEMMEASAAGKSAFGSAAISNLKNFAISVLGIGAAVSGVVSLLREARRLQDDSANRITDQRSGIRALRQVAGNDDGKFNQLTQFADRLRTEKGYTPTESLRAAFQAGSAGDRFLTPDSFEVLSQLREINFDPDKAIASTQKIQASFGIGNAGGGTFRQNINKILAAAGPSPVMADEIAAASAIATQNYASIGGNDEELLGMMGVFAEATKNPEAAGQQLNSLTTQILKKTAKGQIDLSGGYENLKGLELFRALPELAKQGRLLTPETIDKDGNAVRGKPINVERFIEEDLALKAFSSIMRNGDQIDARIGSIYAAQANTGGTGDLLYRSANLSNEKADAVMSAEKAKQQRELSEENRFGTVSSVADAVIDVARQRQVDRGDSLLSISAGRMVDSAASVFQSDRSFLSGTFERSLASGPGTDLPTDNVLRGDAELQRQAAQALGESAVLLLEAVQEMRQEQGRDLTPREVNRIQRGIQTSTTPTNQGE